MPASNIRKTRSQPKPRAVRVSVVNSQRRRIENRLIASSVRRVLREEGWAGEISVALVDAARMRSLNGTFLGHDYVTDVLSFSFLRQPRKKSLAGEIVVCVDQAHDVAKGYNRDWRDELRLYVIHGVLHLMGYRDDTAARSKRMRAAESRHLQRQGLDVEPVN